jgi:hypothetical protein
MDQLGWKVILSSYNITKYLATTDLVEFSKTCKFIKNKLAPSLFKAISFSDYHGSLNGLPLNEIYSSKDESHTLSKLEDSLKRIIPQVKKLIYKLYHNEMLFLCIPVVFANLTILELFEAQFTLDSFNKISNELTRLKCLYLNEINLVVSNLNPAPIAMAIPHGLEVFRISFGQAIYKNYDPNLESSYYSEFGETINMETLKFNIEQESLSNLRVLEINQDSEEFRETQLILLSASSRLTRFSTRFAIFEGLSQINFSSLTSLTLTNVYQSNQDFGFQTLLNLIEFEVIAGIQLDDFNQMLLFDRFLNIANLGLNAKKLAFPYISSYPYTIEDVLQKFTNLTELTLNSSNKVVRLNPEKFPNSIKSLNIHNIRTKFIDIENITQCPGLCTISIYYDDLTFKFEEVDHFKGVFGWKLIHFYGSSIKCYRE